MPINNAGRIPFRCMTISPVPGSVRRVFAQHGMVRVAVPRGEVVARAEKLVRDLMAKKPKAFSASKAWMRKPVRVALERAEQAMVMYRAAGGD